MVLIIKYSYVATIEMVGYKANHRNCILGVVLAFFFFFFFHTDFNFLSPFEMKSFLPLFINSSFCSFDSHSVSPLYQALFHALGYKN